VRACLADHSILSFSFILEENKRPGIFKIEHAHKAGIPESQLYSLLQHGIDIEYKGKKTICK
jgi:ribonuclease Z